MPMTSLTDFQTPDMSGPQRRGRAKVPRPDQSELTMAPSRLESQAFPSMLAQPLDKKPSQASKIQDLLGKLQQDDNYLNPADIEDEQCLNLLQKFL